jgi:hypothetical protein
MCSFTSEKYVEVYKVIIFQLMHKGVLIIYFHIEKISFCIIRKMKTKEGISNKPTKIHLNDRK